MEPKNIIAPLQHWLLGRGRCVGCGRLLGAEKRERKNGIVLVTCECRRIFVYEAKINSYRRALFEEIDSVGPEMISSPSRPILAVAG